MKREKDQKSRIRRLWNLREGRELRLTLGFQTHEHLSKIVKCLPTDFEPYGSRSRSGTDAADCSSNCRWFHILAGARGADWGICANPKSPRSGLLTFEHMGCPQYEWDTRDDYLDTAAGMRALARFKQAEDEIRVWRDAGPGKVVRGFSIFRLLMQRPAK